MSQVPQINPEVPTTNKFGVQIDALGNSGGGILMPKLKYRYRVLVYNFGNGIDAIDFTRQVITCGRPQLQFDSTELHSYNNIAYIPQKPKWQTIEVAVRDDIANLVTSAISSQVQDQMNFYTQSSAVSASNFKFQMAIQILDGTMNSGSNILEEWYLEGCYIEQVQYDSLDYASSDPVQITMTIRYDNATQGNESAETAVTSSDAVNGGATTGITAT